MCVCLSTSKMEHPTCWSFPSLLPPSHFFNPLFAPSFKFPPPSSTLPLLYPFSSLPSLFTPPSILLLPSPLLLPSLYPYLCFPFTPSTTIPLPILYPPSLYPPFIPLPSLPPSPFIPLPSLPPSILPPSLPLSLYLPFSLLSLPSSPSYPSPLQILPIPRHSKEEAQHITYPQLTSIKTPSELKIKA